MCIQFVFNQKVAALSLQVIFARIFRAGLNQKAITVKIIIQKKDDVDKKN